MKFYETSGAREMTISSVKNGTEARPGERDSDIASFLARPVRIFTANWSPSTSFTQNLDIWNDFLTETTIANKISTYSRLRGKLVAKLLINGNALYFGKLVMHYSPFILYDDVLTYSANPSDEEWIQIMQKPHVCVDATSTTGATMEIPMLINQDWIDLTQTSLPQYIGNLVVQDLNVLSHANDPAAAEPLTVTLVAWMEDAELYLPTSTSKIEKIEDKDQTKTDEYKEAADKPLSVSAVLTTVSKMAGVASAVPQLAPFAMATSIVAKAGASVAKLFGYSRPPLLEPPEPFVPRYLSSLANCDVPETVQKLTLNGRQEVCVDPSPMGVLPKEDELALHSLIGRECYLCTATWSTTTAVDSALMRMAVNPMYHGISGSAYYLTPLAYFTQPFRYWRGSIKYRFEVVASAFHRGRLRVVWDPLSFSLTAPFNQNFSVVLDISDKRDFTVVVPYGSAAPYLENSRQPEDGVTYGSTFTSIDDTCDNGSITLSVLNELSNMAMMGSNSVYVNIYVSAGDDFRVAMPDSSKLEENRFVSTSEIVSETSVDLSLKGSEAPLTEVDSDGKVDDVVFGESIVSYRSLLKRYNLNTVLSPTIGSASMTTWKMSSFPIYRGAVVGARDTNNYSFHTLLNHVAPCFLGYRGSIRHKYVVLEGGEGSLLCASMGVAGPGGRGFSENYTVLGSGATHKYNLISLAENPLFGLTGTALTPSTQQPALEVEVPYYSSRKYIYCRNLGVESVAATATEQHAITRPVPLDLGLYSRAASDLSIADFVSIGEDFSLNYFICTPVLYRGASPAPA